MNCPECHFTIADENINITADIAKCNSCGKVFVISDLLKFQVSENFNIHLPPKGTWFNKERNQIRLGASTRSPIAIFLVPFMLIWSGGSVGSIYGSQLLSGEFDPGTSLFGLPFLIGSVIFWGITLMAIWGKNEIILDRNGGKIFTGISKLGITRKFTWPEISVIKEDSSSVHFPGSKGSKILLEGSRRISFGNQLNDAKRYYLLSGLRSVLHNIRQGKNLV